MENLKSSAMVQNRSNATRGRFLLRTGRICVDILIAISIFFLTPWAPLVLVIGAIFYFKNFYEAIAAGVLIDMLYGVSLVKFFHTQWAMTLLFLFIYFIFNYAKRYTRFYGSR